MSAQTDVPNTGKPESELLRKVKALGLEEIIFANRGSYNDGHWYANIAYYCEDENKKAYANNGKPDTSRLCRLNISTGEIKVLLDAGGGSIRDPQVHYDAGRIIFAWRKPGVEQYHLYEINVDGSGLKQLTSGNYDDYEPTYLPDGSIIFVSTRCQCWVSCWMTQVGVLYRCDGEGNNIRRVSSNIEHDNTPSVLPDGRILFTRWEYVDRSQIGYHHLWTMNPDGTGQMVYYGNQRHFPLYIAAKPIPGTTSIIGIDSPGHGRKDHLGHIAIINPNYGPDDDRGILRITKEADFMDPWPLSENCYIAARGKQIFVVDRNGNREAILASDINCYEPQPLIKRLRETILPERTDPAQATGRLILTDVYNGRNMEGIQRGDIKKLLILEVLPKPVNFSGGPDMVSWLGTFNLERVLGTVPVEKDGSAFFELPAHRPVFFVALDENDMSVKRMQSFVSVMPGETTSCVGCHEERSSTPMKPSERLMAMQRSASRITPFSGLPDVLDYSRDIQPILDNHCVKCHGYEKRKGKLLLGGDMGPMWRHGFVSLFARQLVIDGRNGYGNQPPRTIGTSASKLMKKIDGTHQKVKLSDKEWRTIWLWIESAAPYSGSYAGLRSPEQVHTYGSISVHSLNKDILNRRCYSCHGKNDLPALGYWPKNGDKRGVTRPTAPHERLIIKNDPIARFSNWIIFNVSRPEFSPLLLGPLSTEAGGWGSCEGSVFKDKNDPDYIALLNNIKNSSEKCGKERYSAPNYKPNRQYIREMKRFGILPESFDIAKDKIDIFETDQKYWKAIQTNSLK